MYYLSVAAIFKNENRWLKEWIDYHIERGIEHFYLYNNDDDTCDSEKILQPYIVNGLVTHIHVPGFEKQMPSIKDVFQRSKHKTYWLAVIDIDEFILPRKCDDIPSVLSKYEAFSGLFIHWMIFGSNGHIQPPPDQRNYFLKRADDSFDGNRFVKSVVKPIDIDLRRFSDPHHFYFNSGFAVNENYEETNYTVQDFTASKIRINHYCVRSWQDFHEIKMKRGLATPSQEARDENFWNLYDRNEIFDDEISKRFG